jgi:nucleotidyltransferase/DNA polymerase involved in DNA repair
MTALVCCLAGDAAASPALEAIARSCSPRVASGRSGGVLFDASGLTRAIGSPSEIATAVRRLFDEHRVEARVALAGTATAAWLLAHAGSASVVVAPGGEAAALAPLPLGLLAVLPEAGGAYAGQTFETFLTPRRPRAGHYRLAPGPGARPRSAAMRPATAAPVAIASFAEALAAFERWGLRTVGDVARLPRADVHARLGAAGVRLHQAACGEDAAPIVAAAEAPRFVERLELEWPIDGLEPLSFVLSRLCDALSLALERADRGAIRVATRLRLVTRQTHARTLELPAPMRDARVLRTLITLDLESHPPPAAIDVVELELDVAPGRIVQGSLLGRSLPTTEEAATLVARLSALMGDSRVGTPVLVDSHDDRASAIATFTVRETPPSARPSAAAIDGPPIVRRYRFPIAVRVELERGRPVLVDRSARGVDGGRVVACAGPWRTSGYWWAADRSRWDRDAWDVELADGVYRLTRDRLSGHWEIEGALD